MPSDAQQPASLGRARKIAPKHFLPPPETVLDERRPVRVEIGGRYLLPRSGGRTVRATLDRTEFSGRVGVFRSDAGGHYRVPMDQVIHKIDTTSRDPGVDSLRDRVLVLKRTLEKSIVQTLADHIATTTDRKHSSVSTAIYCWLNGSSSLPKPLRPLVLAALKEIDP